MPAARPLSARAAAPCGLPGEICGVLGQVRTALTEFVVEVCGELGEGDGLPSAEQTDEALHTAINVTDSNVTIMHATRKEGDIMPDGPTYRYPGQ